LCARSPCSGCWARPGSFDAGNEMAAIEHAFHIAPVLFLPLVLSSPWPCSRSPFTAIFLGALAGGCMAVFVAPGTVTAFSAAGETLPRWLALIKGLWLAFASGHQSNTGYAPIDELASRGGMASMLATIWPLIAALVFASVVKKIGVLVCLITSVIAAAKSIAALVAALVSAVLATNVATAGNILRSYCRDVCSRQLLRNAGLRRSFCPGTISASGNSTSALNP
jgi:Na+:H+ antiporter, NhaC family